MLGWVKYRGEVKSRVGELAKISPESIKGYLALANSTEKSEHLDKKTRELIALAVAVTTRCDGCIASHIEAAIKHGVSREELAEALNVAMALNAGAALVYSARALDCYEEFAAG